MGVTLTLTVIVTVGADILSSGTRVESGERWNREVPIELPASAGCRWARSGDKFGTARGERSCSRIRLEVSLSPTFRPIRPYRAKRFVSFAGMTRVCVYNILMAHRTSGMLLN